MLTRLSLLIALICGTFTITTGTVSSAETGWSPRIIATGDFKAKIESTPIELRPNRPLHFYGNTLRRRYYRAIRKSATRTVSKSSQGKSNVDG